MALLSHIDQNGHHPQHTQSQPPTLVLPAASPAASSPLKLHHLSPLNYATFISTKLSLRSHFILPSLQVHLQCAINNSDNTKPKANQAVPHYHCTIYQSTSSILDRYQDRLFYSNSEAMIRFALTMSSDVIEYHALAPLTQSMYRVCQRVSADHIHYEKAPNLDMMDLTQSHSFFYIYIVTPIVGSQ